MAKDKGTGDLGDNVMDIKAQLKAVDEVETFDGGDSSVAVDDNEQVAKIPPKFAGVEDAEISEPQGPDSDEEGEDEVDKNPTDTDAITLTRDDLVKKGVLPPNAGPKRRPLATAVNEQVNKTAAPQKPPKPAQKQLDDDYQEKINKHHSQQGSIALELIKSMLGNDSVGMKTNPKKLVERAYEITDELQKEIDARHKQGLMDAFVKLNSDG